MKSDNKYIKHNCEFDKLQGYRYSSTQDIIKLAEIKLDPTANTKRSIFSESSKIWSIVINLTGDGGEEDIDQHYLDS